MVQLYVYDPQNSSRKWELDLYESDPIKITLTAESITEAGDIESAWSRNFRLPQSRNNDLFFKEWYNVNGVDFDVTKKIKAELFVNNTFFKEGQLRLTKVIVDKSIQSVDYECLFMGAVRDFSSAVGQGYLNSLNFQEYLHVNNVTNIQNSWQAYPEGQLDYGLFNGDILYPLIDFGNTYDSSGSPIESRISTTGSKRFTQNSTPMTPWQFHPMIRAKVVFDKIFAETPYTYKSDFLNSDLFRHIYTSAFGNVAATEIFVGASTTFEVTGGTQFLTPNVLQNIVLANEVYDQYNVYNANTGVFTAPSGPGYYKFAANPTFEVLAANNNTNVTITIALYKNGVATGVQSSTFFQANASAPTQKTLSLTTYGPGLLLNTFDTITLKVSVITAGALQYASVVAGSFACTQAPGGTDLGTLLSSKVKKIDFIKSILSRFRLVMVPDVDEPSKFIIEPWINYIGTGDQYDWSDKIIYSKDLQIEPLFYTQSATDTFTDVDGKDALNELQKTNHGEIYGSYVFDSQNELIVGDRKIESIFAPTPTRQIEGEPDTSNWVIPQLHKDEMRDGHVKHTPIEVEPRLLFYNGLVTIDPAVHTWYIDGGLSQGYTKFPMVSYHENWPPQGADLNLNWQIDDAYYGVNIPNVNGQLGSSVYDVYWSQYIESLYSPEARKLTAYFNLGVTDLYKLTFNDVIFVEGAYWRVQKIYDVPIGENAQVKVDLIKLLNYIPKISQSLLEFNAQRTGTFIKNNCESGYAGSNVEFSKTYTSNISQENAEQIANATFPLDGQAYANTNGTCTLIPVNTYESVGTGSFTRNNCGSGYTSEPVTFSKTYTSTVSQAAADAARDANFGADGQAYANANGVCTLTPIVTYSAYRSGTFTRNNCGVNETGSTVTFTRTYISTVSQADADSIADAQFAGDGQTFANENGTCTYTPPPTYTANRSGSFTRNNCSTTPGFQGPPPYYGTTVSFTKSYTSTISQADAEAIADANFNADGQAYANTYGDCVASTAYTASRSGSFTRNNCPTNYTPSTVTFNKDYTSYTSQAEAESIADANFAADGQAYANSVGTCTLLTYSAYRTGSFTKNDCGVNETGSSHNYTKTYTSNISQADADAIANANFNIEGQAFVNAIGTCTYTPPTTYTAYRIGDFTKNNCHPFETGSVETFSNTYISYSSQADAEAIADANFAADGQAYANSVGTCNYNPPVTYYASRSGSFTRNNCPTDYAASTVSFSKTYESTVSQADAEAIADANFNTDGQNYANANGTCTPPPPPPTNCKYYLVQNPDIDFSYFDYVACDGTAMGGNYIQEGGTEYICAQQGTFYGYGLVTGQEQGSC